MFRKGLTPKFLRVFSDGYNKQKFFQDLTAGVIVGVVALPLAIAFGIASGVTPAQGLITAVIAGFIISFLSGSNVQIGGPTGAFIVIVYSIVTKYGYDGLAVATVIAGVLLVIMGLAGIGSIIKYIPYPLTVGFTSGIAVIIFTGQVRDFLGLNVENVPAEFIDKIRIFAENISSINIYSLLLGLLTLFIILVTPRFTRRIPGSLFALLITTAIVYLTNMPVETIGSRFGEMKFSIPSPALPDMDFSKLSELFSVAVSIALLAGIESLLSAVVADGMTEEKHNSNMELVAQGVANIVSPLFGGIPATGAIARTATNIKNGGKTPIAGIIHALTLFLIMIFLGKWAALIPMATLAGILVIVAWNMSEMHLFVKLFKSPKSDVLVLLITFMLTVFVDLTVAIQVGVVLSAFLFMRRMAEVTQVGYITKMLNDDEDEREKDDANSIKRIFVPKKIEVFEINGSFFFGAAERFRDALAQIETPPKVLILRMRKVIAMDATGLRALEDVHYKSLKNNVLLVLSGVHTQPLVVMQRSGLYDKIGEENIFGNINEAIEHGKKYIERG